MRRNNDEKQILEWTDIAHAAYAIGVIDSENKTESLRLRAKMLKLGRVTQVARGRYQMKVTTNNLLKGITQE